MRILISILLLSALTATADTNLVPFLQVENGKAVLSIQASNGIGNFRITGSTVTATNPVETVAVTNEWVTSQYIWTARQDFAGFAGIYLTNLSASAVNVTALGRHVLSWNNIEHTVYLVELPAVTVVASVVLATNQTASAFAWGNTNVTLTAGTTYALLSSEAVGEEFGDYDTDATFYTAGGITNGLPCFSNYINDTPTATNAAGHTYGPVSMKFGNPPPM